MNHHLPEGESARQLLLSVKDAAKRMSLSPRTLFSLTASGELPAVRIGRAVRYSIPTLEKFVADRQGGAQ